MKSIEESKIEETDTRKSPPENYEGEPGAAEELGTFSQCYEPNELAMVRPKELLITYEDVLTDPRTKELWQKYFRHDTIVSAEVFVNCLSEEFKDLFPSSLEVQNTIFQQLKERVSLDGSNVSLNALQVFTREQGLQCALKQLVDEVVQEHSKESLTSRLTNEEILSEIEEVKQMLGDKHKVLVRKEQALREKELTLQEEQGRLLNKLADFAQERVRRAESGIARAFREQAKKLENSERLLNSKIAVLKRLQSQTQSHGKVPIETPAKSASEGIESYKERYERTKARVASLEQHWKEAKAKCEQLGSELGQEKTRSSELAKQAERAKLLLKQQELKVQRLEQTLAQSQSQSQYESQVPMSATKVGSDLHEDDKVTPSPAHAQTSTASALASTGTKTKAKDKSKDKEKEKEKEKDRSKTSGRLPEIGGEHIATKDIVRVYGGLVSQIVHTVKKSLPYYISIYKEQAELGTALVQVQVRVGELLYPAMEALLPTLIDALHAAQGSLAAEQLLAVLEVAWETVNFAFETQALPQLLKPGMRAGKPKPLLFQSSLPSLKKLVEQSSAKPDRREESECSLPIYPLIGHRQVARVFFKDLEQLLAPKVPANKGKGESRSGSSRKAGEQIKIEMLGCLLMMLLTESSKQVLQAVQRLKKIAVEETAELSLGQLLCEYRGISTLAAGSTLKPISEECVGLFLALSIDVSCKAELWKQLSNPECFRCLEAAFDNAITSDNDAQQDELIVLIHKLLVAKAAALEKEALLKLRTTVQHILQSPHRPEREFFLNNAASLQAHLESLHLES